MITGMYPSINEVKAIWACEMIAGRREGASFDQPRKGTLRKALSSLLTSVSSFLF